MQVVQIQTAALCLAAEHTSPLALSLSLLCSVETVNDGQFHSVELVMLNQTLNLVVDKGAPKSLGKLQKQPAVGINSPLYLGGNSSPTLRHHLAPPFPPSRLPASALTPRADARGLPDVFLPPTAKVSQRRLPGGSDSKTGC